MKNTMDPSSKKEQIKQSNEIYIEDLYRKVQDNYDEYGDDWEDFVDEH